MMKQATVQARLTPECGWMGNQRFRIALPLGLLESLLSIDEPVAVILESPWFPLSSHSPNTCCILLSASFKKLDQSRERVAADDDSKLLEVVREEAVMDRWKAVFRWKEVLDADRAVGPLMLSELRVGCIAS